MTPEQWHRVKEVFEAALELAPEERSTFLGQACAGDESLHSEVESLLRSYEQESQFMETPAAGLAAQSLVREESALLVGQQLGHYQIVRELGRGGMGVVYLAQDTRLGRPVALKLLPTHLTSDPDRLRRFEGEARAASALNHPNILTIYEIGQVDTINFIATEFIDGVTLRERIKNKELNLADAINIAKQMASALAAAHEAGIVHRDIKPENVMLRRDGYVKVLDFGLAKLTEVQSVNVAVGSSAVIGVNADTGIAGTAGYMSPEQAQGRDVDQRSDIFSFGVVLYEMLTSEMAFRHGSNVKTMSAMIHEESALLSALRVKVPAGVERVVRKCLEKAPEGRYANGGELVASLREVLELSRSNGWGPFSALDAQAKWWQTWWIALAGAVLVLVLAGGVWWRISRTAAENPQTGSQTLAVMKTAPLTGLPGKEEQPAFSPDGKYVAFASSGEGDDNWDIYVKPVDGGAPQRLTTDPAADLGPSWSPDGRYIAFMRFSENGRAIVMMPALGGPERKLLSTKVVPPEGNSSRIDWSPDGKSLIYSDASAPKRPSAIYSLSYETLETQQLTFPPETSNGDYEPVFSPDGKTLAFNRWAAFQTGDIYVMSTAGGEPRRLTFDNKLIIGLAWTPDGRSIVFSSPRGGGQSLWRILATGGEPERLGVGGDNAGEPAISRQGQRLAYATEYQTMSIWRVDLPDSRGKTPSRTKLLSTTAQAFLPQISPDGKRIVFSSYRSGAPEIWECDSDGSHPIQLTTLGHGNTGAPRWSPDGRYVAFDSAAEARGDIYVIGANGGQPRRLTDDPSDDIVPSWSRDGRWIYFASNRTGEYQVWKMPAEGGEAGQVTQHGGFTAFESPDGQYVYYAKGLNLPGLWRVPTGVGQEELVLNGLPAGGWGWWAVAEKGIYFAGPEGKGGVIEFFELATRRVTRIATMDRPPNPDLALSPDERWLLYTEEPAKGNNIVLVENFR